MEEERVESVYDSGYGNPCRYLQQVLNGFFRCLGLERSVGGGGGGGSKEEGGGAGGDGGGEMDDPLTTPISDDSSTIDPVDEPASATRLAAGRPPSRGPISSGGSGQTN
ncbi:unnamed protein product [Lactuca saligna]|uniref:Uncharacterized protein n=1 Tax=Lactuca saligna TaxID=75948 RepID=A0AA36ECX2_LACSI|nr:unnamed protein product [Lactuca saligna]